MATKRPYDPNDPTTYQDPLGPAQPGMNTAPTAGRAALLDALGPPTIDSAPNNGGGWSVDPPTIESSPTEGVPPKDPSGTVDSSPTEGVPPTDPTGTVPSGPGNGGGWEAPPGTPVPTMGDPTIGSSPTPNGGGWGDPLSGPPPPVMDALASVQGGASTPPTSSAPTVAKTSDANASVPSTITSYYDNPSQPDPNAPDPGVPPPIDPTAPPTDPSNPTGPTNPTGPGHPGPITGPAPGTPPFDNKSPSVPPKPGDPGTFAPGSPNDPAWKGSDPAQAALAMLNSTTTGGVPTSQLVDLINQHFPSAAAKYYPPGSHDSSGNEYIGFPGGYLARVPGGAWEYHARGPETPATPAAPATGNGGSGGPYQPVGQSPYNQQLRDFMMSQLSGLSHPIDANSGELAPAISAYNTQSQRDQQTERDQLAEHAYAGGNLDSGGFDTQIRQGIEGAAGKRANFSGSMVYQANLQRRQQLQAMLQTATSAGLTDQAQAIQQEIARVTAQLQSDSLGFSYAQLLAQISRDTTLAGMNG